MVPAGHNRPRGAPNSSTLLPSLGKEAMLATAGRGDLPWSLIPAPPTATKSSPVSRGAGEPLSLPGGGGRLSPGRLPAPPVQGWLVPCLGPFKVFFSISVSIQAPLFSSFHWLSHPSPPPLPPPFFTLPPTHSNLRPRPQTWAQLLLWVSRGLVRRWVRGPLRTGRERWGGGQKMVPLTILECGQDRPLWKKELTLTPAGSRRQLSFPTII